MVQIPEQQQYLAKLLGYQYTIIHKPGKDNKVADALSRQPDPIAAQFLAISQVQFELLDDLRAENSTLAFFKELYAAMTQDADKFCDYEIREGLLVCKGKLAMDPTSPLVQQILKEGHSTLLGGHGGIQKTTARVSRIFTWPGLHKDVKK